MMTMKVGISNYPELAIEDECMVDIYGMGGVDAYYGEKFQQAWDEKDGAAWMAEYAWRPSSCDPCSTEPPTASEMEEAGFEGNPRDAFFTRLRMRYTPEAGTQDITLYTSGLVESDQIRYIDYNELMEDRFEVCGIGMVEDPGSCDPDGTESRYRR